MASAGFTKEQALRTLAALLASPERWFDVEWCGQFIGNSDWVCDLRAGHSSPCWNAKCRPGPRPDDRGDDRG